MRIKAGTFLFAIILTTPVLATNPNNPHHVTVLGTADVEVQNTVEVEVVNSTALEIGDLPPINFEPGQSVIAESPIVIPGEILILQGFLGTNSADADTITVPKDMILRTITIIPSSNDTDPNLIGCGSSVRWPQNAPIDPASMDRYIVSHRWKKSDLESMNYAMPYELFLPQGSELTVNVGRIGSSGFCEALFNLTGTTL